jgi:hypothetical protein
VEDSLVRLAMLDPFSGDYFAVCKALRDAGLEYTEEDRIGTIARSSYQRKEILVHKGKLAEAQAVLRNTIEAQDDQTPSFCPRCDGEEIVERTITGFLGLFSKNVFFCRACGHKWGTCAG